MFGVSDTSGTDIDEELTPVSAPTRGLAILAALIITAALLVGYFLLRRRHAARLRTEQAAQTTTQPPTIPAELQLFVDDAMIRGPQAVLGGYVLNISNRGMTNLYVELELKRRKDNVSEFRVIALEPRDLEAGRTGQYSLSVPSREYRESHVRRILGGQPAVSVSFKTSPGAQRPNEPPPEGKAIIVKPTPRRGKGEEFLNTPDNPVSVP